MSMNVILVGILILVLRRTVVVICSTSPCIEISCNQLYDQSSLCGSEVHFCFVSCFSLFRLGFPCPCDALRCDWDMQTLQYSDISGVALDENWILNIARFTLTTLLQCELQGGAGPCPVQPSCWMVKEKVRIFGCWTVFWASHAVSALFPPL